VGFSDRFLSAMGGWQRGWQEEAKLRFELARELDSAIAETNLSQDFQTFGETCYRKRFLVPNNPQNGGDFGPLFINGFIPEGVASWTTNKKFAQEFKDPTREGTFAAIFCHVPAPNEVLLNIPALWADRSFQNAACNFRDRGGENSDALFHFKFRQSELILRADLRFDELIHICGRSSPFDMLCEIEGLQSDEERDRLWQRFVEADIFPEEAYLLSTEGTRAAMDRVKEKFLNKHGSKIDSVLAK